MRKKVLFTIFVLFLSLILCHSGTVLAIVKVKKKTTSPRDYGPNICQEMFDAQSPHKVQNVLSKIELGMPWSVVQTVTGKTANSFHACYWVDFPPSPEWDRILGHPTGRKVYRRGTHVAYYKDLGYVMYTGNIGIAGSNVIKVYLDPNEKGWRDPGFYSAREFPPLSGDW